MGKKDFSFQTANLIIFGRDKYKDLGYHIRELKARNIAIICDKNIINTEKFFKIIERLKSEKVNFDIYHDTIPEVPIDSVEECINYFKNKHIELVLGIGGGSSLDTAKITSLVLKYNGKVKDYIGINLVHGPILPTIMMPTTAGTGAEVTPNAIVSNTKDKLKQAIVSRFLLPEIAVVDPSLTDTVPPDITAYTGMDAFTHALESFVSNNASPMTDIIAIEAIKLITTNLESAVKDGSNIEARDKLALASMFGGMALTGAGTGGIHAMAYPLGGEFNIPHGLANTILLKHVVEFNIPAAIERFSYVANAMEGNFNSHNQIKNANNATKLINDLVKKVGINLRLRDFGITNKDLYNLAKSAKEVKRLIDNNPRKMTISDIENIYRRAM